MKAHLLYVEDDESLSFVTRDNLELAGYQITCFENGQKALDCIRTNQRFDLCILDVMLPDADGFTIAEEIRKFDTNVPIIFLTAKSMKEDKIRGLRLGADDYITKPFSIEELILKIEIFLKRSKVAPSVPTYLTVGKYLLDHKNLSLKFADQAKTLTQKEADLLKVFIEHKGEVLKRSMILKDLWGEDDYFLGRSLDVFISRLRKYLNQDPRIKIENIHSVGFKMRVDGE